MYQPKPLPLWLSTLQALVLATMLAQNVADTFLVAILPFVIWYFIPAFVFLGILYGALDTTLNVKLKNAMLRDYDRYKAMVMSTVVLCAFGHGLNVLFYAVLHSFLGRG